MRRTSVAMLAQAILIRSMKLSTSGEVSFVALLSIPMVEQREALDGKLYPFVAFSAWYGIEAVWYWQRALKFVGAGVANQLIPDSQGTAHLWSTCGCGLIVFHVAPAPKFSKCCTRCPNKHSEKCRARQRRYQYRCLASGVWEGAPIISTRTNSIPTL